MTTPLVTPAGLSFDAKDMEVGLKVARVGLGTVDYLADTVRCDALAAEFFGLPEGRDVPRDVLHGRIHPEDWPEVEQGVDCLLQPGHPQQVLDMTHRIVVEGRPLRWVNARKQVRYDAEGRPVTGVFALVDITARVLAEKRAEFLIGELNHRGKNLLAVVAGMVRQIERHSEPGDLGAKLQDRLAALGRNQDAILRGDGGSFGLRDIVSGQIGPFGGDDPRRVAVQGPELQVGSHAAQSLAMVLHELATNAAKYGSLSREGGRVEVVWKVEGEDLLLRWSERGGPQVSPGHKPGFGTQVLTRMTEAALGAVTQMRFAPEGLEFDLRAPLEAFRL